MSLKNSSRNSDCIIHLKKYILTLSQSHSALSAGLSTQGAVHMLGFILSCIQTGFNISLMR